MFRKILFAVFVLLLEMSSLVAQEKQVIAFEPLEDRPYSPVAAYVIENTDTNTLATFIEYNKGLDVFHLSKDFEILDQFGTTGLPRNYNEIIGQTIKEHKIQVFMKTSNNKNFGSVMFDFKNKFASQKEFNFKLKKEYFLQTASMGETFYIFTLKKKGSVIGVYQFDAIGNWVEKSISLENETLQVNGKDASLVELIKSGGGMSASYSMNKLDVDFPNAVESSSEMNKFYQQGNKAYMTFDKSGFETYLLEIDLNNLSHTLQSFEKPKYKDKAYKKTSSFLKDGLLLQFMSNNNQMDLIVQNWKTKEVVFEHTNSKFGTIPFANTLVIIEGGMYNSERVREVEETEKFLSKISRGSIGVSLFETENGYQMTLGGVQALPSGGGGMMMPMGMGGIPVAQFGQATVFFNPVVYSYSSYANSKSIRVECLFDTSFNDVEGPIEENVFDRIALFEDEIGSRRKAETIQILGEDLLYFFYDKKLKTFRGFDFE